MKFHRKAPSSLSTIKTGYLVVTLNEKPDPKTLTKQLGKHVAETVTALLKSGDFKAQNKQQYTLFAPAGLNCERLLLVGLGKKAPCTNSQWYELSKTIAQQVCKSSARSCQILLPDIENSQQAASDIASQIHQHCYRYDATLGNKKTVTKPKLSSVTILSDDKSVSAGLAEGHALGLGLRITRELGNLPANICTPSYLQQTAETIAADDSAFELETLEEADMRKLGMGSLLSVAEGSVEPAKLITWQYHGGGDEQPVVLVGKGVTFDTGGISLKPSGKMDEMKYDMCGAASVLGVMQALATLKPAINVCGVIPATENMPAGNATKPGDVVTSMSGKTIEVLNTDAEGRLILCDAITYAERFKPKAVIDIATLTGACIVALGHHRSAVYSNDDELATALYEAGEASNDLTWRMPLDDTYSQQLKSSYADLANIGGPGAGSITAACFLAKFAEKQKWAHLDIAGAAWNTKGIKGASGRPVALLMRYLLQQAS